MKCLAKKLKVKLQKKEEVKRRVQPLTKLQRKKPDLINITYQVLSVLSPFLNNPEEYCYQLFCKPVFFSGNTFNKEDI